jgi:hypothetical protein
MSIPISAFRVKIQMKLSPRLEALVRATNPQQNGTYYVLPIEHCIPFRALRTGDWDLYQEYLEVTKQTEVHSVNTFKALDASLTLETMTSIQANLYDHTNYYWVQDGIHRLCILLERGITHIPLKHLDITVYEKAKEQVRTALRATVGHTHYNGWNNRLELGYHSFDFFTMHLQGQRNPTKRLERIRPAYDFTGKRILDLGCNTGGMLLHIPEAAEGVGLDYDAACLRAAEFIRDKFQFSPHLRFLKHDLNTVSIPTLLSALEYNPDIVFLLSIGSWVKDWRKLYRDVWANTKAVLLETNNDKEGAPQLELFRELGGTLQCLSEVSDDDCTGNLGRKTYLITR